MVVHELCLEMKVQVCMCVRLSKIHCTVHQIYVALACGLPLSVCVCVLCNCSFTRSSNTSTVVDKCIKTKKQLQNTLDFENTMFGR